MGGITGNIIRNIMGKMTHRRRRRRGNEDPRGTYGRRGMRRVFMAAAAILVSLFLYQTCRLYLEHKVLSDEAGQWRSARTEKPDADKWDADKPDAGVGNCVEYQGKTYRRNTYVKAVLCMGIDRSGSLEEATTAGSGGQADGIFLVAQDTARERIRVLMIPRDTMTEITLTDLRGNVLGKDIQHLTLAYAYGDGREKSCRYMTEAVGNLLGGLPLDGYMAVSMSALPIANDRVGGVTVTIEDGSLSNVSPEFVRGRTLTLQGKQAEAYVRYRDTGEAQSALVRTERQKSYIRGFLAAARNKSGRDEGFVPKLMKEIEPYMVTDMAKDRYLDMALAFLRGSQEFSEADMLTLPGTAVETPVYDEYHPDKEKIMPIVLDLFYRLEE